MGAYMSALGSVAGLVAAPPDVPLMTGTGFSGLGAGTNGPTGLVGAGAPPVNPLITPIPGLPLTLTGSGLNTGGRPVLIAAEDE